VDAGVVADVVAGVAVAAAEGADADVDADGTDDRTATWLAATDTSRAYFLIVYKQQCNAQRLLDYSLASHHIE
jgi:hypothetical protein